MSLSDYLSGLQTAKNKDVESFLQNASGYTKNRDLLTALGEEDKSKPTQGLLSKFFTVLNAPGNIVRGGLLELAGRPNQQLRNTKGFMNTLGKLASGEIQATGADFGFKSRKDDNLLERIGAGLGRFAVETVTDPLSYVGAPSSISRKAGAELLLTKADDLDFLRNVAGRSVKKGTLIEELAAETTPEIIAKAQKAAGIPATPGTPAALVLEQAPEARAAATLANKLSTKFLTEGRRGLIRELTDLTGSKTEALSIFKTLPDDVRGGLVVTGLTGKPLVQKSGPDAGKMIRITQGTGEALGKLGDVANVARQAVAVFPGNVVSRNFSGAIGPVIADVKKAEFLKRTGRVLPDELATTRLIDYTFTKKALENRNIALNEVNGKLGSIINRALVSGEEFVGADRDAYQQAFSDFFLAPNRPFDEAVDSAATAKARETAMQLRDDMNELYNYAKEQGIDLGEIGTPETFSPFMLTDKAIERMNKTGARNKAASIYDTDRGRRSWVEYLEDQDVRNLEGFEDPNNPGVTYLTAAAANKRLQDAARAAGKSAQEIEDAAIYLTDPVQIIHRYGQSLANKIATKRFVDTLVAAGVVIKDAPNVRKLINEWESRTMAAAIKGVLPETRRQLEAAAADTRRQLEEIAAGKPLEQVKAEVDRIRAEAATTANVARARVQDLSEQVVEASAAVDELTPRYNQLRSQLVEYRTAFEETAQGLATGQRTAKNVNDRIRRAKSNLQPKIDALADAQNEAAALRAAGAPADAIAEADLLVARLGGEASTVQAKLAAEQQLKSANDIELAQIKSVREQATRRGVSDIEQQILEYEQAVTRRNTLVDELTQARKARDEAVVAAKQAEARIAIEQVTTLNTLINDYVKNSLKAREFKMANPTRGKTPQEVEQINARAAMLDNLAAASKNVLTSVLKTNKKAFSAVANKYADEVLALATKLTDEQLQAALVMTNEAKILDLMEKVQTGLRDDASVMAAVGDMYFAFAQIRKLVPESALKRLEVAQREILEESNFGKLKDKLIREEKAPSLLADRLVDMGYEVVPTGKTMQDLYASKSIISAMENIFRLNSNANEWEQVIAKYLDPYLAMWRASVTMGRGPGFTLNNLAGGFLANHIGDVSLAETKQAQKALGAVNKAFKRIRATNPNLTLYEVQTLAEKEMLPMLNNIKVGNFSLGDLLVEFNRRGGFNSTEITSALFDTVGAVGGDVTASLRSGKETFRFATPAQSKAEEAYRSFINAVMTNPYQQKMNDLAASSEALLRFSAFVSGAARYGNLDAAMNKVYILHFNYQDLSNAERWVKRFVPFYTWMRNNVPAQMRAALLQPGKLQRYMNANEAFAQAIGADQEDSWMNNILPEYMNISGGFASKFMAGENNLGFFMKLPYTDLDKYFEADLTPIRTRELLNSLGLIKTPIELLSGTNLSTGAKYDPAGEIVPGIFKYLGGKEGSEGEVRIPGALYRGATNLFPMLGVGQRAAAGASAITSALGVDTPELLISKPEQDKALSTLINLIGGPVGAATLTPRTFSGELRRRTSIQGPAIDRAVAALGIDETWARDLLKRGATPEEIAALIAAGQGKKAAGEETVKLDNQKIQKYREILGGL